MITYSNSGLFSILAKLCQMRGSVFPKSALVAGPAALLAGVLKLLVNYGVIQFLEDKDSIVADSQAWSGFSFFVGFLIIFRTSQSYSRFWEGCKTTHAMRAEWYDACSTLAAYCEHTKAMDPSKLADVVKFKQTIVRLFSVLHACCLAELEEINRDTGDFDSVNAYSFPVIDPISLDKETMATLKVSTAKTELVHSWIQCLIIQHQHQGTLTVPAPLLAKVFNDISAGMVAFNDGVKMSFIPFPFPYVQTCDFLLVLHWLVLPFVCCHWVTSPVWAVILVFMQVFILWSLNYIAIEIENPFGVDPNDLDGRHMQQEFNQHLTTLLQKSTLRVPEIHIHDDWFHEGKFDENKHTSYSLNQVFMHIDDQELAWSSRADKDFTYSGVNRVSRREMRLSRISLSRNSVCQQMTRPSVAAEIRNSWTAHQLKESDGVSEASDVVAPDKEQATETLADISPFPDLEAGHGSPLPTPPQSEKGSGHELEVCHVSIVPIPSQSDQGSGHAPFSDLFKNGRLSI